MLGAGLLPELIIGLSANWFLYLDYNCIFFGFMVHQMTEFIACLKFWLLETIATPLEGVVKQKYENPIERGPRQYR